MISDIIKIGLIFVLVDSVYLYSTKDLTRKTVQAIQKDNLILQPIPTILCYIILVSSIYYFIILKQAPIQEAFLLGFFIYGVFETTNLAIFKKWSPILAMIDTIWGGVLFTITTLAYRKIQTTKIF